MTSKHIVEHEKMNLSEQIKRIAIRNCGVPGDGGGGGLDIAGVIATCDPLYWRLDGANAPPTANWDMGNFLIENIGAAGTDFTAGGGLNIATDLDVNGHSAFGSGAAVAANRVVWIRETSTAIDTSTYGLHSDYYWSPSGALGAASYHYGVLVDSVWDTDVDGSVNGNLYGTKIRALIDPTSSGALSLATGILGIGEHRGTGAITSLIGVQGDVRSDDSGGEAGNVTDAYSLLASGYTDKTTGTITNRYGLYVSDMTGAGNLTNQYGIYIEDIDAAATLNYAIYVAGGSTFFNDDVEINVPTATEVGLTIQTTDDNATENIFETKDSAGNVDFCIDEKGWVGIRESVPGGTNANRPNGASTNYNAAWIELNGITTLDDASILMRRNSDPVVGFDAWFDGNANICYFDNRYDNASTHFAFRLRTYGTPVEVCRYTGGGEVIVNNSGSCPATAVLLQVRGSADHTANLQEWQDSTSTPLTYVEADGEIVIDQDSKAIKLGGGQDMSIYYDGANGVIDTSLIAASDLNIDCGTDKTVVLEETVWNDFVTPLTVANLRGVSNNPTLTQLFTDGAGSQGVYGLVFADGNEVLVTIQMPHDWKEGTDIYPHIHFMCLTDVDPAENFAIEFEYTWADFTEDFPANSTLETNQYSTGANTDNMHQLTNISANPLVGSGHTTSSILLCRIKRVAADGDNYAGGIAILDFDIHYEIDTMGNRTVLVK